MINRLWTSAGLTGTSITVLDGHGARHEFEEGKGDRPDHIVQATRVAVQDGHMDHPNKAIGHNFKLPVSVKCPPAT
jgi:hypothetical protein